MSELEIAFMVNTVLLGALALVVSRLYRKLNVWIEAVRSNCSDEKVVATPALLRVWKKQIKRHKPGSPTYESYRGHLTRAGEKTP